MSSCHLTVTRAQYSCCRWNKLSNSRSVVCTIKSGFDCASVSLRCRYAVLTSQWPHKLLLWVIRTTACWDMLTFPGTFARNITYAISDEPTAILSGIARKMVVVLLEMVNRMLKMTSNSLRKYNFHRQVIPLCRRTHTFHLFVKIASVLTL